MNDRPGHFQRRYSFRITHKRFQTPFLLFCFAVGTVTTTTSIIAMQFIVNGFSQSVAGIRDLNWDQIEVLLQNEASKATLMIVAVSLVNIVFTVIIAFF